MMTQRYRALLTALLLLSVTLPAAAQQPEELLIPLAGGEELSIQRYRADGAKRLLLWLPSEYGLSPRQRQMAADLTLYDFEVWLPELHSSLFLLPGRGSLREVEPALLTVLLNAATRDPTRTVYLMASGGTAPLALQGARQWQLDGDANARLAGAVLLHPKFYTTTPQGGESADYLPVVRASNVPIYLFQPMLSSGFWRLRSLAEALAEGGSPVYTHWLPEVSDGFNTRPDFTQAEAELSERLPTMLEQAVRRLDYHGGTPTAAAPLSDDGETLLAETEPRQMLLRPYTANGPTPALNLPRLDNGDPLALPSGKVTVLNFWTTWCPPCVEEIPSLNRLYRRFEGGDVAVIGVDVGETAEKVNAFLKEMEIAFPILLDQQAAALKRWNVYAFPTTFILDREQRIRYAVFGAFDWSSPEVVETLERLRDE